MRGQSQIYGAWSGRFVVWVRQGLGCRNTNMRFADDDDWVEGAGQFSNER
jgi:hypothetical protein